MGKVGREYSCKEEEEGGIVSNEGISKTFGKQHRIWERLDERGGIWGRFERLLE